mmetsp:Transcript_22305/g.34039  ORF Transcript_22305/g.34039 Transcript_22305/m.34039 type:complete len:175 (+) Transcript_22305:133-657(+)
MTSLSSLLTFAIVGLFAMSMGGVSSFASAFAPSLSSSHSRTSLAFSPAAMVVPTTHMNICLFASTGAGAGAGADTLEKPSIKKSNEEKVESKPNNSKGWAVRLYNDPMNKREFVARCLTEICSLSDGAAFQCMMQAHQNGRSVIGNYHREMAEFYRDQLTEQGLMIDMIPLDDE